MEEYIVKKPEDILGAVLQNGFAILEDVLSPEECEVMRNEAWGFFESVCSLLKRDDPSTWKYIFELHPMHHMLHRHWGIGQAQYVWNIRQKPKIISIYRKIWNSIYQHRGQDNRASHMKVSFDGTSFLIPPEVTNKGWDGNPWYHINQRYDYQDIQGVQSFVTSEDIGPGDSTLVVLKGSNMRHSGSGLKTNTGDRRSLTEFEMETVYLGCERVEIMCKAGSMVFWDPRTVHYSKGVTRGRDIQRLRNTIYLCYAPKTMITPMKEQKRRKAFEELRTSSNWPDKMDLVPVLPRKFDSNYFREDMKNALPKNKPILDEFGEPLV